MARSFWLARSEPSKYSWDDLVRDGSTYWDGVRNYQARNNLQAMAKGDLVLFYHSVVGTEIVGIARVTRTAYPDPTSDDPRWVVVDLDAHKPLERPVSLAEIKSDPALADMALVRQSRLSVMPVDKRDFERILALGQTRLR